MCMWSRIDRRSWRGVPFLCARRTWRVWFESVRKEMWCEKRDAFGVCTQNKCEAKDKIMGKARVFV